MLYTIDCICCIENNVTNVSDIVHVHTASHFVATISCCQKQTHTSVYYVLQSQLVATGYANDKIHKEAVKIDIKCNHGYTKQQNDKTQVGVGDNE